MCTRLICSVICNECAWSVSQNSQKHLDCSVWAVWILAPSFLPGNVFYLYAYEPAAAGKGWKSAIVTWYQKFKESVFFRKLFLLFFVTSMILFRTLLNRNLWMNPLSKVMGGWGIWETVNGEQKLTTECIENVIMMVPFSSVVMWTFKEKTGNGWKKILWYSGKIAFIFSVSIEMLQLLLRLGTFQLSDIFYNTVGGMLGGLVYYVTMKARKHL